MTTLEQYNKELYHFGIKGMKWGVRRYQNKDGSLTNAGRKRLDTEAGWYLNPKYKDKKSVNRKAVSKEYTDAYNKLMRKYGIDTNTMDGTEASWELEKKSGKKNPDGKLWNSFLDKYATATLKDLGYKDSTDAKEYVKELFRNDLILDSHETASATSKPSTSGSSKKTKRYFEMNDAERKKFDDNYIKKRKRLIDQYKAATNDSEKARIKKQVDKLENDYLDEVERDW